LPNTNAAAARVLDRLGIEVTGAPAVRCCGAIDYHLDARTAGLTHARRNIDAWWPAVQKGAASRVSDQIAYYYIGCYYITHYYILQRAFLNRNKRICVF
jgi:Fe-S oxidoreductase